MADDPDPQHLKALEQRIAAAAKKSAPRAQGAMHGLGQGEAAWRMVIELTSGIALGLAIGFGLDILFGTKPILMVVFVLLGFAAGIKTMLGTAAGLAKQTGDDPADEKRD
ncbi:MAG: AtpZ/AtpI family protein [Gemmobacter sp.]|nr:AtpZ/AtpI family protein [Gemmobacter sp.]